MTAAAASLWRRVCPLLVLMGVCMPHALFVCFLQVELVGSDVQRSLQCRRDVKRYINLQNLVVTSDAAKEYAEQQQRERRSQRRRSS